MRRGQWVTICQPWFGTEYRAKIERITRLHIFVLGKAYNRRTGKRSFNDYIKEIPK